MSCRRCRSGYSCPVFKGLFKFTLTLESHREVSQFFKVIILFLFCQALFGSIVPVTNLSV